MTVCTYRHTLEFDGAKLAFLANRDVTQAQKDVSLAQKMLFIAKFTIHTLTKTPTFVGIDEYLRQSYE